MAAKRNKVTVGWCHWNTDSSIGIEMLVDDPLQSLYSRDLKGHKYKYAECPSSNEIFKNTYVLSSPFDAYFEVDLETKQINLFSKHTNMPREFFHLREDEYGEADEPIFSLNFHMLFVTEDLGVDLRVTSPHFELPGVSPLIIIPGRVNISDWWRPTDLAFQLSSKKEVVRIKKGDPLLYVNFSTSTPEDIIELKEIELTQTLKDYVMSTTKMKWYHPRCPLSKLYSISRAFTKKGKRPKLKFL